MVVTTGTTAIGSVDPLIDILKLRKYINFVYILMLHTVVISNWHKILLLMLEQFLTAIHEADSIVIDPHKHGLQPYGCGCVFLKIHPLALYTNMIHHILILVLMTCTLVKLV